MQPFDLVALTKTVQAISHIMSGRLLTAAGMLICAGLFGWVLYAPDWIRVAAACAFAVLVYLPLVRQETKKGEPHE